MLSQAHRYAPQGHPCGRVVDGEHRYATKSDGGYCSFDAKYTLEVDGEEIAVCHRHTKTIEGHKRVVLE